MAYVEIRKAAGLTTYWLDNRRLGTGDHVLLRLHGNRGWDPVTIVTMGEELMIRTTADDGHKIITSHDPRAELKWP